jgi:hypothetical protein
MRSFASEGAAREEHLRRVPQHGFELVVVHPAELFAGDDDRLAAADADLARDPARRQTVVASDDDDADAGAVAIIDRAGDLRPGRIDHGDEAEKAQTALGRLASFGGGSQPPVGDRKHAQAAGRVALDRSVHALELGVAQSAATPQHLLGRALRVEHEPGRHPVNRGHHPQGGVEVVEVVPGRRSLGGRRRRPERRRREDDRDLCGIADALFAPRLGVRAVDRGCEELRDRRGHGTERP